uniref:phosphomevalonate dehydratase n=1 Tax=Ignisphaera aggregans TaxID=334771 RepID=A0A7J3QDC0_9CREN
MYDEHCITIPNAKIVGYNTEGKALKLEVLSFLGDIDSKTGIIISEDTGAKNYYIKDKILLVKRFRGSTVGAYVLYSLCKNGLAPKAIVTDDPDPVIIAGIVLCNITGVFNVSKTIIERIENEDKIRIESIGNSIKICVIKE